MKSSPNTPGARLQNDGSDTEQAGNNLLCSNMPVPQWQRHVRTPSVPPRTQHDSKTITVNPAVVTRYALREKKGFMKPSAHSLENK